MPEKAKQLAEMPWHSVEGKTGLIYREHPTRMHGRKPDRYFLIRYQNAEKKRVKEALGWASEGWTAAKGYALLIELRENIRVGRHPQSLKEKRLLAAARQSEEARELAEAEVRDKTFGELAALYLHWVERHRVSSTDVENFLHRHILPVLGEKVAADITPTDIERLRAIAAAKRPLGGRNALNANARLSPQTVLHILKTVREVYNFARETTAEDGKTMLFNGKNPVILNRRNRSIHLEKVDARRQRILNSEEIDRLLAASAGNDDHHDMLLLSLDTGCRAGELVHILRESCDPLTGAIRIYKGSEKHETTKGGTARQVFAGQLFPEALTVLRRRLAVFSASPYLFPGKSTGARDARALARIMRNLAEKTGLNDGVSDPRNLVVWHTLRRTFATLMLEHGCDIYLLKELMGHASVTTTEIYLHLCNRAKREKALAGRVLA